MPFFFLCLFIGIPVIEIAIFIAVGDEIGLLATLALIFATAILGTYLLRQQGLATLAKAQAEINQGRPPIRELFDGVCILIAGCLLLTPGFLTDIVGFLLLLPWVRHWASRALVPYFLSKARFAVSSRSKRAGFHAGPVDRNDVIDGDYSVVDEPDRDGLEPPKG